MDVKRRLGLLLAGTMVGTSILVSTPAFSDEAQLQQQINAMQQQLNALQAQLAQTKKQATAAGQQATKAQQQANVAQQQASASQQAVPYISPDIYAADVPVPTKGPPSWFDTIHIRWPARTSRWKARGVSVTKTLRAPAILHLAQSRS